ncbi:MAG: J domain-containing protein [Anaerolineae bacterium]|nr:J domain-containing protein [Anaerolineae bacterium]
MKNYYRILQVDPQAEQEVIDGAYRRLMRKYHPDVLTPEERNSEKVLRKVQEFNEAYEILGDVQKRQEYDRLYSEETQQDSEPSIETISAPAKAEIEERIYLVKCSTTRRTFKLRLGRRKGWSGPFVVMGIEPLEEPQALPVPTKGKRTGGFMKQFRASLSRKHNNSTIIDRQALPDSDELVQSLYDEANTLGMGDINWAGLRCPDCAGQITNPNGTTATWSMCGTCHHLKCVGNVKKRPDGYYSHCPWCGATNKFTRSVATGTKDQSILRGKYDEKRVEERELQHLSDQEHKLLDSEDHQ